jgi:hypothetical protein
MLNYQASIIARAFTARSGFKIVEDSQHSPSDCSSAANHLPIPRAPVKERRNRVIETGQLQVVLHDAGIACAI